MNKKPWASRDGAGVWAGKGGGGGREAEEEGRMNELSLEVSLATKGFEWILQQKH